MKTKLLPTTSNMYDMTTTNMYNNMYMYMLSLLLSSNRSRIACRAPVRQGHIGAAQERSPAHRKSETQRNIHVNENQKTARPNAILDDRSREI